MKIGFIGMGIMGSRMASNLQQQGHELIIFNRTEDKASHLVANGALSVATPAEVAQQVTIIFTMLAHPDAVREVALSNNGFLNILQAGSLWIDCSTVNPTFSRQMVAIAGYESNVPLPLANTTKEIYQQAIQQGLGQQDFAAIYDFWQSNFKHQVNSDRT